MRGSPASTEKQVAAAAAAAAAAAGGRLRRGSGTLLLWGSLFWNRLYLGRRGGIVDVVVSGSVVGGDVFGGIVDVVVVNFLFVGGNFLV